MGRRRQGPIAVHFLVLVAVLVLLQRVMGLILAATAVQFVVEGIATLLPTIVASVGGSAR